MIKAVLRKGGLSFGFRDYCVRILFQGNLSLKQYLRNHYKSVNMIILSCLNNSFLAFYFIIRDSVLIGYHVPLFPSLEFFKILD